MAGSGVPVGAEIQVVRPFWGIAGGMAGGGGYGVS
jgi:hypothetical protein